MTGKTISHYEVKEQLGKGGMGVVYRARDTRLDRDVALKFLPPEMSADADAKARFIQEAKAASALDHPNICTIHEIGESDEGKLFIAMSFYDGQTLKYLLEDGPLPTGRAAGIAAQIAAGLLKAHHAGIVHRDIKPANIMVAKDGLVKILDFGLAKLGQGLELTKAGSTVGTTAYMSPEQSSGERVDGRTDVWSLGVILYEMLSGRRAFGGGYDQAVLYSVMNEDPAPLGTVPEDLSSVVMKMLAKDPAERFTSADDVVAALDPFASGISQIAVSDSAVRKPKRPKWIMPAAAVASIALASVLWVVFGSSPDTESGPVPAVDTHMIAVLPFNIQGGPEMEYLSESMVTLLGTLLDGAGSTRTVDHAAILERIENRSEDVIGPAVGQEYANHFGAGRFILGSIFKAGNENRISARLYLADGTPEKESVAAYEGDNNFMAAIDELAVGLVGGLLSDPDQDLGSLAAGTTSSFEALKNYLNAEKLVRAGKNSEADVLIQSALRLDSTFALAWYLQAEIDGWLRVSGGYVQRDLAMAKRYEDQLSGRARRLLDAELAFNDGRALEAARLYRSIIEDYPNDIEATGQLAEVYVHYSQKESDQLEALRLIEKVNELTPGSQQFSFHHSDLLAFKGRLNGNFHGLDSLAAVYAGMDIPPVGQLLDWSLALDRMNPDTRRTMVIHARVSGSPEDSAASYNRAGTTVDIGRAWAFGFLDVAEATNSNSGNKNIFFGNPDWYFARARGQFEHSGALNPTLTYDGVASGLVMDVLDRTLPAFDASDDALHALNIRVERWDVSVHPPGPYTSDGELVRAYLQALIAFRLKDRAAFEQQQENYNSITPDSAAYPTWISIRTELRALQQWLDGDTASALTTMNAAQMDGLYFLEYGSDILSMRHQVEWFLAELYELNGDLESALEWYKATVARTRYAPAGWERAAAIYERLGETDEAIRYYGLMINQWRNADPFLQPRVEAARVRIDALLDSKTREPG